MGSGCCSVNTMFPTVYLPCLQCDDAVPIFCARRARTQYLRLSLSALSCWCVHVHAEMVECIEVQYSVSKNLITVSAI